MEWNGTKRSSVFALQRSSAKNSRLGFIDHGRLVLPPTCSHYNQALFVHKEAHYKDRESGIPSTIALSLVTNAKTVAQSAAVSVAATETKPGSNTNSDAGARE